MAKRVSTRPDWIKAPRVIDIYSVSSHVSDDFADYVNYWRHNGYWFFDSPTIIRELARQHAIDLSGTKLFFYEVHEAQFNDSEDGSWTPFHPESSFITKLVLPSEKTLEGYDVVTFYAGTSAECSPLSCNSLASDVETDQHCLLRSFDEARRLLEQGRFKNTEPGPFRIFAVYSMAWPDVPMR
jgi:hypothetical protein